MKTLRLLMPVLLAVLAGCAGATSVPPNPQTVDAVTLTSEQGGRFIALVGPRRQHAEPFLGVAGTNFAALRSWIDTRGGERVTQLYVEDSYFGGERNWEKARDAAGQALKFIPISKNEISCENGCSYAEEFAAELPEKLLRASPAGLGVTFTAKLGLEKTIAVPGELVAKQLAALDAARPVPAAAMAAPPPAAAPAPPR